MAAREKKQASASAAVLLAADTKKKSVPVWLARDPGWLREAPLSDAQRTWAEAQGFKSAARKHLLLPGPDGALAHRPSVTPRWQRVQPCLVSPGPRGKILPCQRRSARQSGSSSRMVGFR